MAEDFRKKLMGNGYQRYFQRTDFTLLSDLGSLWEELAEDLKMTPEEVESTVKDAIKGQEASYLQVKKALKRLFVQSRHPSTEVGEMRLQTADQRLKFMWDKDSWEGTMTIQHAMRFFTETNVGVKQAEIDGFEGLLREQVLLQLKQTPGLPNIPWETYYLTLQDWKRRKTQEDPVTIKLKSTIADYQTALQNLDSQSPQRTAIQDLITTLETQLKDLTAPSDPAALQKLQRRQFKSLQGIFSFYCKQQLNGGKRTFENISESNSNWNLGKFVKFAVDFKLTGKPPEPDRVLSKEELKLVFISCADSRKLLDFAHFLTALSQIADRKYDSEYDKMHGTNVHVKSLADKQALLYIDLHLEDVQTLKATMKSFSSPFTHEKEGFRLPENDPAKRYQPMSEEQREALRSWQKRKAIFSKSSESISSLRSSSDILEVSMAKIPSDAVALKRAPPASYSEIYHLKHHPVSLTWQTLSNMEYGDINIGDDLEEVIGLDKEDTGETMLDRQYHFGKFYSAIAWKSGKVGGVPKKSVSERKYDGLMRIVEEKPNKAGTALRRLSTMSFFNQSSIRSRT